MKFQIFKFITVCLLFILSFSYFSANAQCTFNFSPTPGHYCPNSNTVPLTAWDSAQTGGCFIVPAFIVYISLGTNYNYTSYFFTAYQNGGATNTLSPNIFSVGSINEWIIECSYFSTTGGFCSFKFCDTSKAGTFPYKVYDRSNKQLMASGTISGSDGCTTVVFTTRLTGTAKFSGAGVTNYNNGFGLFDPSVAGPGIHNIQYYWNNRIGFADSISKPDTVNPSIPVTASPVHKEICFGDTVHLHAYGASSFSWSPAAGLSSSTGSLVIAKPTHPLNIYTLKGTDDSTGCSGTTNVTIIVNPLPVLDLPKVDSICPGTSTTLNPNYTGTATYTWQDNGTDLACKVSTLTVNSPGTYSLTITDIHNCSSSDTEHVFLYTVGKLNLGPNDTINEGDPFPVLNPVSSYTKYTWQDGSGNPTYKVTAPGKYWLTVIDKHGCIISDSIIIYETCKVKDVFVPNIFLPDNGTSCNVSFMLEGRCISNVDVKIYNRWGVKIYWDNYDFTINQPDNNNGNCNDMSHQYIIGTGKIYHYIIWDGTDKRNGDKAGEGAYFYVIKYNFRDNPNTSTQTKKGTITILRN